MRHQITEARAEAIIDARVWRVLATDRRYRFAANAEEQAEAEAAITAEVEAAVNAEYCIFDEATYFGRAAG